MSFGEEFVGDKPTRARKFFENIPIFTHVLLMKDVKWKTEDMLKLFENIPINTHVL